MTPRYNLARSRGRGGQEGGRARAIGFPAGAPKKCSKKVRIFDYQVPTQELLQAKYPPGKSTLICAPLALWTVAPPTLSGGGVCYLLLAPPTLIGTLLEHPLYLEEVSAIL